MNISVVIPCLNQHELTTKILDQLSKVSTLDGVLEIVVLDNGSDVPFEYNDNLDRVRVIRYDETMGVYPTIFEGLRHTTGDIIANFHNDLIVWEQDWDLRVLRCFGENPRLGLIGFVGSNQIDPSGGRGLGTTSNFKGLELRSDSGRIWKGSAAHIHGAVSSNYSKGAVVDGCAMIFRREALSLIPQRTDFPPHHFYDRLLCTEMLERDWEVGVLGIACDHFSGQTVGPEPKYDQMARSWAEKHIPQAKWAGYPGSYSWDQTIYQQAERMWLEEYRAKGYVPYFS